MRKLGVVMAVLLLASCSGTKSQVVTSLKHSDKQLNCQDIQLEINEAQFFQKKAEENKGMSVRNMLSPFGYASTYMSAEEAVEAAGSRIAYLNQVYEIKRCAATAMASVQPQLQPMQPVAMMVPAAAPLVEQGYYPVR